MNRVKLAIPVVIIAGMFGAPAYAQAVPANQPPVESAWAAAVKAPYRLRTIFRPSTSTGMSRDTPDGRVNWYKEPSN